MTLDKLTSGSNRSPSRRHTAIEVLMLMALFFVYAGDASPMVNEAHYLVKAKNFWQPDWCANDLFVASGKAHTTFYVLFGWPTRWLSLEATAWIGRMVGWLLIAIGLHRLTRRLIANPFASLAVAIVWIAAVEYGNLAGEWVIGGIEAKVPAYGFVLLAIADLVDRRWNRVWIWLGIASALHVLSGGWSVIAATLAWWLCERPCPDRRPFFTRYLFVGGAIALLGVVPAVWLTIGAEPAESAMAAKIYTYYRLSHHLLPSGLMPIWYLRHGLLFVLGVGLAWQTRGQQDDAKWNRMRGFAIGAMAIAMVGLLLGLLPMFDRDLAAKLLRYYWFRLTDAVVPLWVALLVVRSLCCFEMKTPRWKFSIAILLFAVGLFGFSSWRSIRLPVPPSASNRLLGWDSDAPPEVQQKAFRDWLSVCQWIRVATKTDAVFLTPRHQQTFKWYAERAEVANWKDVPQDAKSLIRWYERMHDVYPKRLGTIRVTIQYASLIKYREKYGVDFIVVDRRVVGDHSPLVRIYPIGDEVNDTYAVYELPYALP
ncbi:DUF6798 domain-containing protein [Novipirellula artificiosorum]|uniref:DUF6798 domain-containing protein n=1 Tax=Novipirellula artificiosorum TaxID=2528016 RepID=A0A5C6D7T1_9BACT|nr:DUF6798 domain-containing protein [Novipirellula artificiosorum]TWU31761.1 hypothetical protein Poly41_59960 [Novipirellula artificiosorum]